MALAHETTRKATNITLSADVLAGAKSLGINISKACDEYLREVVAREQAKRWRADHAEFIEAYNKTVAEEGLPLEQWRSF